MNKLQKIVEEYINDNPESVVEVCDKLILKEMINFANNNKMETKYFIPKIEDIRVGYEYEYWSKSVADHNNVIEHFKPTTLKISNEVPTVVAGLEFGYIRTPYLTKEQLEEEGWILEVEKDLYLYFRKDQYKISFLPMQSYNLNPYMNIFVSENAIEYYSIFKGICPSINEFRTICKLLNIK